jgi:Mn-containing catalase
VCRLYEMTTDRGVRDMLSFLIARDTMHQNQWLAAIAELEDMGIERTPCPSAFPRDRELAEVAYQYVSLSTDGAGTEGSWTRGQAPDGVGRFEVVKGMRPMGGEPELQPIEPEVYGTPREPFQEAVQSGRR